MEQKGVKDMKQFKEVTNELNMACVHSNEEYNTQAWHVPQLHANNLYNNYGYRYKPFYIEYYEKF